MLHLMRITRLGVLVVEVVVMGMLNIQGGLSLSISNSFGIKSFMYLCNGDFIFIHTLIQLKYHLSSIKLFTVVRVFGNFGGAYSLLVKKDFGWYLNIPISSSFQFSQ